MEKRKKPQEKQSEGIFFVEVANKNDIRVSTLESIKIILKLMHGYEGYKLVKHEKETMMAKLRSQLKEISSIVGQIKSALPAVNIKFKAEKPAVAKPTVAEQEQKVPKIKASKPKQYAPKEVYTPTPEPKREMSELERLESELNAIEQKLQGLG